MTASGIYLFAIVNLRCHQIAYSVEDNLELPIILAFELVQSAREVGVRGEHLSELYEGSHDFDVDLDRPLAIQNGRQHEDSVLGESVRCITKALAIRFGDHKL
jgi:hypothetical protein